MTSSFTCGDARQWNGDVTRHQRLLLLLYTTNYAPKFAQSKDIALVISVRLFADAAAKKTREAQISSLSRF